MPRVFDYSCFRVSVLICNASAPGNGKGDRHIFSDYRLCRANTDEPVPDPVNGRSFRPGERVTELEMDIHVLINLGAEWIAPAWIARNVFAHVSMRFEHVEWEPIEAFFRNSGRASEPLVVDLRTLSNEQFDALYREAQSALRGSLQESPSEWHDPKSYDEFVDQFKRFVILLGADNRVAGQAES